MDFLEWKWILIEISWKFVPKVRNITALVRLMAWRRPGDKPLSEPVMVRLPTHICITRSQWVNPEWVAGLWSLGSPALFFFFHHIEDATKWLPCCRRHFQLYFHGRKFFCSKLYWILSPRVQLTLGIDSDYGLVMNSQQAITWIMFYVIWCH